MSPKRLFKRVFKPLFKWVFKPLFKLLFERLFKPVFERWFKRVLWIGQRRFIVVNFVKGIVLGLCLYQYIPSSLIGLMSTGARAIGFEYLSKLAWAPAVNLLATVLVLLTQLDSLRFTKEILCDNQSFDTNNKNNLKAQIHSYRPKILSKVKKQAYVPMLSGILAACAIGYVGLPTAVMYIMPSMATIGVNIISKC